MDIKDPFERSEDPTTPLLEEDGLPDDLLSELDKALNDLEMDSAEDSDNAVLVDGNGSSPAEEEIQFTVVQGSSEDFALRQMQETFLEISRNVMAPLDRYMKALASGESSREVLEISELIVTPLIPKTEAVDLNDHAEDLAFFRSLLLLALGEREQASSRAMKEVVMEGFSKLSAKFGLRYRGSRPAVRNLVEFYRALRSNDAVSEADIRRFFAVGVPSLTWVRRTPASELSNLTGVPLDGSKEIRRLAYTYRAAPRVAGAVLAREDSLAPAPTHPLILPNEVRTADVVTTEFNAEFDPAPISTVETDT